MRDRSSGVEVKQGLVVGLVVRLVVGLVVGLVVELVVRLVVGLGNVVELVLSDSQLSAQEGAASLKGRMVAQCSYSCIKKEKYP